MEFLVVGLGVSLPFLLVPLTRFVHSWRAERRAVREFRACYRRAKLTIVAFAVNGDRGMWTESEVVYLALEAMKLQTDIKCGKHRFGESATVIIDRTPYLSRYLVAA